MMETAIEIDVLPADEETALSIALGEEREMGRQFRREAREVVMALRAYAAHLEDRITIIGNLMKAGDHHALSDMMAETKAVIEQRGFSGRPMG